MLIPFIEGPVDRSVGFCVAVSDCLLLDLVGSSYLMWVYFMGSRSQLPSDEGLLELKIGQCKSLIIFLL